MDKPYDIKFYQNLGKLFYAIAASDKEVREEELLKLKETVKKAWLTSNIVQNDVKAEAEHSIINTFKWLNQENEYDAEACFKSFISYKKNHELLFTKELNSLILKTANSIASSFSGKNKSELIMLAKLNLELNKT